MNSEFRANIWKLYAFKFFIGLHLVAGIIVPFFTDWANLSFTQIMILQSWFLLWIALLEIPTGTIADVFGRKISLALGAFAIVPGAIIYASIPNFYVFLLGEFVFALGYSLMSGAEGAFAYDTLKGMKKSKESKVVFGRLEIFYLMGLFIAAPLGSVIAAMFGLRMPMLLMAVPCFVAFLIALTMKEPKTVRRESKNYIKTLKAGVRFFYKHKVLRILAVDFAVINMVGYVMLWAYQALLKDVGFELAYFGFVTSLVVFGEMVVINNYSRFEKILGSKRRYLFFSAFVTGVAFILASITSYLPLVILSALLALGFGFTRRPLMTSYMNKFVPSSKRATVLSAVSMFSVAVIGISNPFVGMMIDWSLRGTLMIIGTIAIVFSLVSRVEEEHLID